MIDTENTKNSGFLSAKMVRDISVVLLMLVVAFRLAKASFDVELKTFDFNDLLSLILAIFSVALSVAFYFQADRSSKQFYDDSYKFTKDMSEILGRIEAGFGERLRHIDESYVGLSQKFDRMPTDTAAIAIVEKKKEAEIQEQEARREDIFEDLMKRAHLDGKEKEDLKSRLSVLSAELDSSRTELARLQKKSVIDKSVFPENINAFVSYIRPFIEKHYDSSFLSATGSQVAHNFLKVIQDPSFDSHDRQYMQNYGLLRNGALTSKGVALVLDIIKDTHKN